MPPAKRASAREELLAALLRAGGVRKRSAKPSGPTSAVLEKRFGFSLGPELRCLCDVLRGARSTHQPELLRPEPLSLTDIIRGVHKDLAPAYLEGFFSGASVFARMYNDIAYAVAWSAAAAGNQRVFAWHWDEGYAEVAAPSVAAFAVEHLEGADTVKVPTQAKKRGKLPQYVDPNKLWKRARWLTYAFQRTSYGEAWSFMRHAAPARAYTAERRHLARWPHLGAHWLWWSFFFGDGARLQQVLKATAGHRHPFVVESRKLVADFEKGRGTALYELVQVEEMREQLAAHAPRSAMPAAGKAARAAQKASAKAAGKTAAANVQRVAARDPFFAELKAAMASKKLDYGHVHRVDRMRVRDREELGELPHIPAYFAKDSITAEDYDRIGALRVAVTREHRDELVKILRPLAKTKKPRTVAGLLIELVTRTCASWEEALAVVGKVVGRKPTPSLAADITYAARLFPKNPRARKRMLAEALQLIRAIHDRTPASPAGYLGLFQLDTQQTATMFNRLIVECEQYTLGAFPWRVVVDVLKRSRALKHAKSCRPGYRAVVDASYHSWGREQAVFSWLALDGAKVKPHLKEHVGEWKNVPVKRAPYVAGMLWLEPRSNVHAAAAKTLLNRFLKGSKDVRMESVAAVTGLVMAIEGKRIRALYPQVQRVVKWKPSPSRYDSPTVSSVNVAAELLRRRAARLLESR